MSGRALSKLAASGAIGLRQACPVCGFCPHTVADDAVADAGDDQLYSCFHGIFGVEVDLVAAGMLHAGAAAKCRVRMIALAAIHAGLLISERKRDGQAL